MRGALIVGIDYYESGNCLHGCVNDAHSVKNVLEKNADDSGDRNFDIKILTAEDGCSAVNKGNLKDNIEDLFTRNLEVALFYFAGHGHIESSGGYIMSSDGNRGDDGVSLSDILNYANESPATNKIIVLDSCHSGEMGNLPNQNLANLAEGVTILTASTKDQYATERKGRGLFTGLFVDALTGSAANLTGDVTPGSVYAHIDQSLGAFEQRPVFKTNVSRFVSLRKVTPAISKRNLRKIARFFPTEDFEYKLDPTYEPEMKGRDSDMPDPIEENTEVFSVLQKYNRLNLLRPVDAEHMWHAAMESKSCKLTFLGEHYRKLVEDKRI